MKGFGIGIVGIVVLALLLVPFAAAGITSAIDRDRTPVVVERGSTDRFHGGDWVRVRAGDVSLGVLYGTPERPNRIVVFAEVKRYLGAADFYDSQGNYLGTRGLPVYTVFGQSLESLIEFQDDGDGLLNFTTVDRHLNDTPADTPVKLVSFFRGWTLTSYTDEEANRTRYVNFTVAAENVLYDRVITPEGRRNGTPDDGAVERIAFTFRLRVNVHEVTLEIPWFRVTLSESREITHVERLENRTKTGPAMAMGAKYDHLIEGWDFANASNMLALENRVLYGDYFPERIVEFIHKAFYHGFVRDDEGFRRDQNITVEERPTLITKDRLYLDDEWERVGRLLWISRVEVDGQLKEMAFQIQGGAREILDHGGALFIGFHVRAAFLYPAGQRIFHDPRLDVGALDAGTGQYLLPQIEVGTIANLAPLSVLALQLVIAGVALGPAVWLRVRGRTDH